MSTLQLFMLFLPFRCFLDHFQFDFRKDPHFVHQNLPLLDSKFLIKLHQGQCWQKFRFAVSGKHFLWQNERLKKLNWKLFQFFANFSTFFTKISLQFKNKIQQNSNFRFEKFFKYKIFCFLISEKKQKKSVKKSEWRLNFVKNPQNLCLNLFWKQNMTHLKKKNKRTKNWLKFHNICFGATEMF